jgi:hypothetical protein
VSDTTGDDSSNTVKSIKKIRQTNKMLTGINYTNMHTYKYTLIAAILLVGMAGCDQKNDDLVTPLSADAFPQVISFDDEGNGGLEDEDKFSFKLTLNNRTDPKGEEPGGTIVPLDEDVNVSFEIADLEGFEQLADYIKGAEAFYEVDDCNDEDVEVTFDAATGTGTVVFPKGVEEVEVEFETDEDLFSDDIINADERSLTAMITGITGSSANVTYNSAAEFTYKVLDDEAVHGEWTVDHNNTEEFEAFKSLFGLINDEIKNLSAADVNEIIISIEYDEIKVIVELVEMETITECDESSEEHIVIEIESGIEELTTGSTDGDIEFAEEIEQDNGKLEEYVYKGSFEISGSAMILSLEGEYDGDATGEIILNLEK